MPSSEMGTKPTFSGFPCLTLIRLEDAKTFFPEF